MNEYNTVVCKILLACKNEKYRQIPVRRAMSNETGRMRFKVVDSMQLPGARPVSFDTAKFAGQDAKIRADSIGS